MASLRKHSWFDRIIKTKTGLVVYTQFQKKKKNKKHTIERRKKTESRIQEPICGAYNQ